jgi:DNA topoisomerase-6 subunit B
VAATEKKGKPKAPPKETAATMAGRIREISISEFFAKNRHLLGFDNPLKSLLTAVREGVDNALDACEEAGILPEVVVQITEETPARFRVSIEDNGPGILKSHLPSISPPQAKPRPTRDRYLRSGYVRANDDRKSRGSD